MRRDMAGCYPSRPGRCRYALSVADYDEAERERLEAEDQTAYGTSYPMHTCEDVANAIRAYGRAPADKRAMLRAAIVRRRAELGCTMPLPETWHIESEG